MIIHIREPYYLNCLHFDSVRNSFE